MFDEILRDVQFSSHFLPRPWQLYICGLLIIYMPCVIFVEWSIIYMHYVIWLSGEWFCPFYTLINGGWDGSLLMLKRLDIDYKPDLWVRSPSLFTLTPFPVMKLSQCCEAVGHTHLKETEKEPWWRKESPNRGWELEVQSLSWHPILHPLNRGNSTSISEVVPKIKRVWWVCPRVRCY